MSVFLLGSDVCPSAVAYSPSLFTYPAVSECQWAGWNGKRRDVLLSWKPCLTTPLPDHPQAPETTRPQLVKKTKQKNSVLFRPSQNQWHTIVCDKRLAVRYNVCIITEDKPVSDLCSCHYESSVCWLTEKPVGSHCFFLSPFDETVVIGICFISLLINPHFHCMCVVWIAGSHFPWLGGCACAQLVLTRFSCLGSISLCCS